MLEMETAASVKIPGCTDERFATALKIMVLRPHSVLSKVVGATVEGLCVESDFLSDLRARRKVVHKELDGEGKNKLSVEEFCMKRHEDGLLEFSLCAGEEGLQHSPCSFIITKKGVELRFSLPPSAPEGCSSRTEAARKCFEAVSKWCREEGLKMSDATLRLVDLEAYQARYNQLKEKYGRKLVENWTEGTDAEKFVYEDVGIASYLSLLWEEDMAERGTEEKPSFVDLGCGNGLLVHILSQEGFRGTGLDIRRRKIWDTFDRADLKVETIVPSRDTRFSGYDWLVGNHSDELTPWIPALAALTSQEAKFMVLPCCPFEFSRKFQRRNTAKSVYRDYLDYVREVRDGKIMNEKR